MFVVVLFCLCGSIVAFATTMYPSAYYGVIGVLIIVATTMILVLLFVNKVSEVSWKCYWKICVIKNYVIKENLL